MKALGPALNKTAPLRSSTWEVITDRGHQLERWVEYYSDIYSRKNIVSPTALDAVECLQTMRYVKYVFPMIVIQQCSLVFIVPHLVDRIS